MSDQSHIKPGLAVPQSVGMAFALIVQIWTALVVFLVIGLAAIILNFAIDFCDSRHLAPVWVILGMKALETLLWFVDVACFVLMVLKEALSLCIKVLARKD